jgi:MFS family permease
MWGSAVCSINQILTQLRPRWAGGSIFGRLIDTCGTFHIAIFSTLGCTFCVAMLSFSTAYYQIFLTQGVGFGITASGLFSCGMVSVGQWFHKRKALALGIVLAGSSTGISPCVMRNSSSNLV